MFLSIIVPIYNVESYLEKCIKSIIRQPDQDFELLLIDDHSTDKSLEIAKNYESLSTVKLITKTNNSGLSDTRNIGIEIAKGKYIMFLDSDDYVEFGAIKRIKETILDANCPDVMYYGFYEEINNDILLKYGFSSKKNCINNNVDFMKNELYNRKLNPAACFGIYKRELIVENELYFKVGILHEDELWTPQVLLKAKTVGTTDYAYYHYVRRDNSITTKKNRTKNSIDIINTCKELEMIFNKLDDKLLRSLLNNHLAMLYMKAMTTGRMYENGKKNYIDRLYPIKKAYFWQEKLKSILFMMNLKLYSVINNFK